MRDDVARNVWQRQRKQTVIFDSNQCLVASRRGSSKRNEITIRQGDDDVACYPLGALGQLTSGSPSADDIGGEHFEVFDRDRPPDLCQTTQPELGGQF